jgi:small subunit ribosomal protein S6
MCILDSNKYAQDPGGVSAQVPDTIVKLGGEVLVSRLWNEQKLAYPINGHKKGAYWLTYLRLESTKLTELDRALHINDNVLRSLAIKIDPRLVDAMVEHAKGGGRPKAAEEAPATAPEGATA